MDAHLDPNEEEPSSSEDLCKINLLSPYWELGHVGIGHNFHLHETGWKWKLTTCFGGDGFSRFRNKTTLGLCPGVDFRFRWRADYVLPEITGALGTGDPLFEMKAGQLQASLDRVEAIFTHKASEEAIFTHKASEVLL
ncbi:hypothetical protein AKJ16_DCAP07177 [Drosera capensis]